MMFGWFRILEIERAAVGRMQDANGVVVTAPLGTTVTVEGMEEARKVRLSRVRSTFIEEAMVWGSDGSRLV